jgi:mannose-6-phosphate isomerase-like protein (cupin superfamily)
MSSSIHRSPEQGVFDEELPPQVKPGKLFRAAEAGVTYIQRFTPEQANLQYLGCGEFQLAPGTASQGLSTPRRESLLFQWTGQASVSVEGKTYQLDPYDILYVPSGEEFSLANPNPEPARLVQTSAPAEQLHAVFHSRFAELSKTEGRVRRLTGKDVYLMFDVTEAADKLVAGYTFFQPYSRSWPPHNHTDQEEAYIFIKGKGAMEVFESPELLSFVHGVGEGDIVTIPMLNYHPVFSQEEPLEFIWCIAGERYWVGDKNTDFMTGSADSITT